MRGERDEVGEGGGASDRKFLTDRIHKEGPDVLKLIDHVYNR
jgi:hypothetical protein